MDHGKEGQSIRWQPQALVAGLLEGLVGAFGTTVQLGKRPHMQRHGRLAVGGRLTPETFRKNQKNFLANQKKTFSQSKKKLSLPVYRQA